MLFIRSLLFTSFLISDTFLTCFFGLFLLPFPSRYAVKNAHFWSKRIILGARYILGLKLIIKGAELLPKDGGYIIACKHQSAFDTTIFHSFIPEPIMIFKKELTYVPLIRQQLLKTGCIPVDRKGGTTAMRAMFAEAKEKLSSGKSIVIFPEGTRTAPGTTTVYNPGVALLYEKCNVPVFPAAINSGYFWPRNSFTKKPGTVVLEIMPALPAGLGKKEFLAELQNDIETTMKTLPTS
ncbi:MAG: 1-acyl-sn-glycerol-3-phosphate acyltransferase [Alphaproteobacteria bacterium]|nr:1-acyl-sn-glycerol-3-phosphate acyltransferase [Alphaproteobacteria bacterium]